MSHLPAQNSHVVQNSQRTPEGGANRPPGPAGLSCVICDMDGLLIDSETVAVDAWVSVGKRRGWHITSELIDQVIGCNARTTRRVLLDTFGPGFLYEQLVEEVDREVDRLTVSGIPTKPYAREFLDALLELPLRRALCTSTGSDRARMKLERVGLLDHFECIVTGDMVANGKPAPDIYMMVASSLNVTPGHCLVFEDSYNGVRSAAAAGMSVCMIPDRLPPTPEMRELADAVLPDLGHAIEHIGALVSKDRL